MIDEPVLHDMEKVTLFDWLMTVLALAVWALVPIILACISVAVFNPDGLAQVLFKGMRPPYHWSVSVPLSAGDPQGSLDLRYVDSRGKECAEVYHYLRDDPYTAHGWGFSESYETLAGAKSLAERECR